MRTAREAFFNGAHRANLEKITGTESFEVACEYALLAFYEEMPDASGDASQLWATHAQAVGAKRVLELLRSLHLRVEPPKQFRTPTLRAPS